MLGYSTTFDKSMNGFKVYSDGQTTITDGTITTENLNVEQNTQLGTFNLTRVSRNCNVDNCLRIGFNDATDVGNGLSNSSQVDINGSLNVSSTDGLKLGGTSLFSRNNTWGGFQLFSGTAEFANEVIFDTHTSIIANATTANLVNLSFDKIVNNPSIEVFKQNVVFQNITGGLSQYNMTASSGQDQLFATIIQPAYSIRNFQYKANVSRLWGTSSSPYSLTYLALIPANTPYKVPEDYYVQSDATLTAVRVRIYKNGVLHSNFVPTLEEFTLPITTSLKFWVGTGYAEQRIGRISFDFTPTVEDVDTTWTIYFRFTYGHTITNTCVNGTPAGNWEYVLSGTDSNNFCYRINSTLTNNTRVHTQQPDTLIGVDSFGLWFPSSPQPTSQFLFTLSNNFLPRSFKNGLFLSQMNFSDRSGLIRANDIVANQIYNKGHVVSRKMVAGYMFDPATHNQFTPQPIFVSTKQLTPDIDASWFVEAGYKFELYNSYNYVSLLGTIDNTDGVEPVFIKSSDVYGSSDAVASVKVFFQNIELTNSNWS
jgi:hypothetical protein